MSACEAFSADHSVDKSARDSVDSKGLYGRLRFPRWSYDELFFFFNLLLFIIKVDLADRVLALASKHCLLCSAVYSHGVVETKGHFYLYLD